MSVSFEDIEKRWSTRIIGKYDNDDGSGVVPYLQKYGKRISDEKLEKYAEYANFIGKHNMSNEFIHNTTYGLFKRFGERLPSVLNQNFDKMFYYDANNEVSEFEMFHKKDFEMAVLPIFVDFDYIRANEVKKFKSMFFNNSFAIVSYKKDGCDTCIIISEKDSLSRQNGNYKMIYVDNKILLAGKAHKYIWSNCNEDRSCK